MVSELLDLSRIESGLISSEKEAVDIAGLLAEQVAFHSPGAAEKSIAQTKTDELAVMVDTFAPLKLTKAAIELSDGKYHKSWLD